MLRDALRSFRRAWRRVLAVEIAFKATGTLLAAAASAAVLAWVQLRSGGAAVTNTDLVGFLSRPGSLLILLLVLAGTASFVLVEHAVLLAVLGRPAGARLTFGMAATAVARVAGLAALCVAVILAVVGMALGLVGAIYALLLSGHDINYYLAGKPPVFLAAAALAGVVLLAAASLLALLLVRWILALPIALFEGARPRAALRESRARVRGRGRSIALLLLVWHGSIALLALLVWAGFKPVALRLLAAAGDSNAAIVTTVVTLLVVHSFGVWLGSFLGSAGHALIVLHVYRDRHPAGVEPSSEPIRTLVNAPTAVGIAVVALIVAFVVPAVLFVSRLGMREKVEITAHRGASLTAPENTRSAVQAAIDAGADWAEIDVQETKDDQVIVLHDQDLMRLADDPRRIAELTLEEARTIDVGTKFDAKFAGEGLPTLQEVIDLARGKIKLNVELKYYGKDPRLARDVARILRENRFADQCVVASLDYASLGEARAEWPELRTAAIVSARVGDPTRLEADQLSMGARLVDVRLLRAAHRSGKQVLVWTVDDPRLAARLIELGVDNIITNDPAPMVRLRDRGRALSKAERLVLAFRVVLGDSFERPAKDAPVGDL